MKAITGRGGKAHITPLMDSMWHQGMFGAESCILGAYENFKADIISNNEVRVRSGIGMLQGRFFCNEPNTYDSITINNGTQGENRIDLIVMRWTVNSETETESAETIVIQGTPVAGAAAAPSAIEGSLDDGDLIVDYPLYEVHLEGINITEVVRLFATLPGIFLIAPGGVVDILHGGHGGRTAEEALTNLGAAAKTHDHDAGDIASGTLPLIRGGTGLTASPSILIDLASAAAANVMQANPRPGVTGALSIANGGTGAKTASAAQVNLLNLHMEVKTLDNQTISAGTSFSKTINVAKSGYKPIAIAGWDVSNATTDGIYSTYIAMTSCWVGTDTNIVNFEGRSLASSSAAKVKFQVIVVYMRA